MAYNFHKIQKSMSVFQYESDKICKTHSEIFKNQNTK